MGLGSPARAHAPCMHCVCVACASRARRVCIACASRVRRVGVASTSRARRVRARVHVRARACAHMRPRTRARARMRACASNQNHLPSRKSPGRRQPPNKHRSASRPESLARFLGRSCSQAGWRPSDCSILLPTAHLAQSAEHKAFNLVESGGQARGPLSPTGVPFARPAWSCCTQEETQLPRGCATRITKGGPGVKKISTGSSSFIQCVAESAIV